jgi:hypothetical protein
MLVADICLSSLLAHTIGVRSLAFITPQDDVASI